MNVERSIHGTVSWLDFSHAKRGSFMIGFLLAPKRRRSNVAWRNPPWYHPVGDFGAASG
jgi:hypothetical protein